MTYYLEGHCTGQTLLEWQLGNATNPTIEGQAIERKQMLLEKYYYTPLAND